MALQDCAGRKASRKTLESTSGKTRLQRHKTARENRIYSPAEKGISFSAALPICFFPPRIIKAIRMVKAAAPHIFGKEKA